MQILELSIVHALIVDLLEGVELCLEGLVGRILLHAHCRKVQELRVKCECRVRVVWI